MVNCYSSLQFGQLSDKSESRMRRSDITRRPAQKSDAMPVQSAKNIHIKKPATLSSAENTLFLILITKTGNYTGTQLEVSYEVVGVDISAHCCLW